MLKIDPKVISSYYSTIVLPKKANQWELNDLETAVDKAVECATKEDKKGLKSAMEIIGRLAVKKTSKEYNELLKARVGKYLNYTYDEPFATGYLHIDPKEIADVEILHSRDSFDSITGKKFLGSRPTYRAIGGVPYSEAPVYDAAGNIKRYEVFGISEESTLLRFYNKDKKLVKEICIDKNGKPIFEDVYKDVIVDAEPRVRHLSYVARLNKFTNELKRRDVELVLRNMKD